MEQIIEKSKCSGCTACMNICPKGAIEMIEDNDGFKYPIINQDKCIDCGLCKRTCPVLNTNENESLNNCYVGYNKDEKSLMNKASSGSIFELAANYVLDQNGIVIGAAFDDNNKLNHIAVEKKKDLLPLKGSKYLQSNLGNIFKYIKENIKERKILFVGTPCQVAGVKAIVKNDNLICIDIVCHGVPTPKLFDKYVKEIEKEYNSKLIDYNFRDKSTGWDTYSNTMTFKKNQISELRINNKYMKLFLSDITLGDFWGIKNCYPDMYNKKGVSAIIINTKKGREIFYNIKNNIVYKECNLDEIISGNLSLKKSSIIPKKRELFFSDIDSRDMNYLVSKYTKKTSLKNKIKNKIKKMLKFK